MGKFRIKKVSGKGKRWKKGHSSSSNPVTVKHRLLAKSRFCQENLGGGSLTTDALKKHDAYMDTKESEMEDDIESSAKTFKTFASDWSSCSNVSFNRFLARFQSDSALHKEMLAILAAVTDTIKSYDGRESSVEYFAAMMSMLEKVDTEESIIAVLSLISMNIKTVPQNILRAKFSEISKSFIELLEKYSESADNTIMRAIIGCLSVILRAQDASIWTYSSTIKMFDSILAFITHSKPKVRRAAQHAICAILKGSSIVLDNESKALSHHPAAKHTAKHCIHIIEMSGSMGGATTTLHILNLWKDILDTFPQSQLKVACETILKVMTLGDTRVTSCGLQALHGLFTSRPSEDSLPGQLNAQLISALFDYQPSSTDVGPCLAWTSVMQEAFNNLARVDPSLCLANLPRLFSVCTQLWLSEQPEIRGGATHCMESVAQAAFGPIPVSATVYESALQKVVVHISAGLSYQYHSAWAQVIHVMGTLFEVVGKEKGKFLVPCLRTLGDLHDSHQFSYARELEFTIGKAIRTMGPQVVLQSIPLQIGGKETNYEFKRSWMLPVLRDNIHGAELKYYIDFFLPLAIQCRNLSSSCNSNNDKIGAHSYDLLQSQLWSLLPSFCNNPPDIKDNFKRIAKLLGSIITDCKELRLSVMTTLRKLITCAKENNNDEDISELSRFAKNYLPLLFNLYTTKPKGSDEEGQRLAAYETIKVYLRITPSEYCEELFDRASQKLELDETPFKKECYLDLLKALLSYQTEERLYSLYEHCKKTIPLEKNEQQKKAYRLLEELCDSNSPTCQSFVTNNFVDLTNLLLEALSKSSPSSKGPRLRCLIHLVRHLDNSQSDVLQQIVPEAILCCKDINERCRTAAYSLLGEIGETMLRWKNKPSEDIIRDYMGMLMLGLAGQPKMVACSLLAVTKVTHQFREYIPEDLLKQVLHNVLLLVMSPTREIVDAALSYIKMYITLGTSLVTASVSSIVKSFVGMTEDCKRHFRTKTRNLLDRFVRKFGYDDIAAVIPADDVTMHKRLKNLHSIQTRKLKQRAKENDSDEDFEDQFLSKSQPKSIEEILAESDDSDLDDKPVRDSETRKKRKLSTWIKEDANSFIDFTDSSAAKKVTATNPGSMAISDNKKKEKKSDFKVSSDGRLIITDLDEDKNIASMETMKLDDFSGSDNEDDEKWAGASIVGSKINRKRKASTCTEPPSKYQAGGSGIHRPIKKAVGKGTGSNGVVSGSVYRAKKASGDVKRKGMPDPYAYVPLSRKFLNRRKKAKRSGQFSSIVKGAVNGASKGSKSKTKSNKRKH